MASKGNNIAFYVIVAVVVFVAAMLGVFVASKLIAPPNLSPGGWPGGITVGSSGAIGETTTAARSVSLSSGNPATFSVDADGNLIVSQPGSPDTTFPSGFLA